MTEEEWVTVWKLGIIKKRKRLDKFIYQAFMNIVKVGGENVIQNFQQKFKELRVEGCHKDGGLSSSVMYTEDKEKMKEDFPDNSYNEAEMKETMFMGTRSEVRRRFRRNGPY